MSIKRPGFESAAIADCTKHRQGATRPLESNVNTYITTMSYALQIAILAKVLEQHECQIERMAAVIAIKDEQLATQNHAAREYAARCEELEVRNKELARQRDRLAVEMQERRAV